VALYRDQGVVLRTIKLGEADRIVTLLTQGHGKVRGVAKGIRKTTSRFGARLEPTSHVAFQAYRGRGDLDTITQVETIDANRAVREDYTALTHAMAMLEAVDQIAQERAANPGLYRMLVGALRTLDTRASPVVSAAFFWKLLSREGFHPVTNGCARCGAAGSLEAFDLGEGGALCTTCAPFRGRPVRTETLTTIERIVGGDLNRVLADPPAGAVLAEVERLAVAALEYHVERRLRSAALL
jgi:DNA repair protein RecO (recombination protein O)